MSKELLRIDINVSELMNDNWRIIFGVTEAVKKIEDLVPLLDKYIIQIKEFIEKNEI